MAMCCGFRVARQTEPTTWVAFLRAINVGGRNVTMAELRQVFEAAGYEGVASFIASGNIVFRTAPDQDSMELESAIEGQVRAALGYEVLTFLRSPSELVGIADAAYRDVDGSHQVGLLKQLPSPAARTAVLALATDNDVIEVVGCEVHWLRHDTGASRLANGNFERTLGMPATFRSVTTLRKIAAKWGG